MTKEEANKLYKEAYAEALADPKAVRIAKRMKTLIQAERGEYEQRYTVFVATDAAAALRYAQAKEPAIEWEIVDYVKTYPPGKNAPDPHRVWMIAPKGKPDSDDAFDLSEIDFAE